MMVKLCMICALNCNWLMNKFVRVSQEGASQTIERWWFMVIILGNSWIRIFTRNYKNLTNLPINIILENKNSNSNLIPEKIKELNLCKIFPY